MEQLGSLKDPVTKFAVKALIKTITGIKDFFDASTEKPAPKEYLSRRAISAIQGISETKET
jgi:hypothetical protein